MTDADDGTGLPEVLIHPDLTRPNAIARSDRPSVVIDWIGVGGGSRAWTLGFLLFAAGSRCASRGVDRFVRSISISLSDEERSRLPGIARTLTVDLWSVAEERMTAQQGDHPLPRTPRRVEAVATTPTNVDRP